MSSDSDAPSTANEGVETLRLPFYNSLHWEPLEILVDNSAPEKLRLNAPDQPNLWAYLQQHSETSNGPDAQSTIEIYDDSHYGNPLAADDLQDLRFLTPYKWICPGTESLLSSVNALKTYVRAAFIVRGHAMAEMTTSDVAFYRTLDHVATQIEAGRGAEGISDASKTSLLHQDPVSVPPPDSNPSTPLSSASDTSEPDRESLERALCIRFGTSALPFMAELKWVSNPDVPMGTRLHIGSLFDQPVFADFAPEAITSVQILIRQGKKLRTAKTVRKGKLQEVDWGVPFSYVVDIDERRSFLKAIFVLEGYSSGCPVDVDEESFCAAVDRITGEVDGNETGKVICSAESSQPRKVNINDKKPHQNRYTARCVSSGEVLDVNNISKARSVGVKANRSEKPGHDSELSFSSTHRYQDDKNHGDELVQSVGLAASSQSPSELVDPGRDIDRTKPVEALNWRNAASSSREVQRSVSSTKNTPVEGQLLAYDHIAGLDNVSLLNEHRALLTHTQPTDALQLKIILREQIQKQIQAHDELSMELTAIIEALCLEGARKAEQRIANLALKLQKEEELGQCDYEIGDLKRQRDEQEEENSHVALDGEAGLLGGAKRRRCD